MHKLIDQPAMHILLIAMPWLIPPGYGPSPSVAGLILAWSLLLILLVVSKGNAVGSAPAGWLLAGALSSAIALIQNFGYGEHFLGLVSPTEAGVAFANLRQRNQFATLTNIGLAVLLFTPPKWVSSTERLTRLGGAIIVLLVIANAASSSRAGTLELMLLIALFAFWSGRPSRPWEDPRVLWALFGYIAGALLWSWLAQTHSVSGGGILSRAPESAAGCGSRKVLWSNVLHLIAQKPWAGWGWGELDYAHFNALYPGERFCAILDNAHNLPLQLAVELGLPLAVLICCGIGIWVWRQAPWRETQPTRQLAWAVLAVIGLHSLLEYPLWYGPFQMAALMCLWMLRAPASSSTSKVGWAPVGIAVIAPLCIAFLGYVGWDYWRVSLLYRIPSERPAAYRDNTLEEARKTWIFQSQVQFAELTTTGLNRSNAESRNRQALQLLHFSPEPAVVEAIIESAALMGDDAQALYFLQRYKAAFPEPHAQWVRKSSAFQRPEWAGTDKTP